MGCCCCCCCITECWLQVGESGRLIWGRSKEFCLCTKVFELLGWSLLAEVFSVPIEADCRDGVQPSAYLTEELDAESDRAVWEDFLELWEDTEHAPLILSL